MSNYEVSVFRSDQAHPGQHMTDGSGLPPLTIMVPVYGALPQTLACLDAIAQTKDEISGVRVLVIDDATPDDQVVRALTNVCTRHGFDLLRNRENLGFVETCNRGFDEVTTGHVLILNSDTVPFPGWLEAMLDTAHEGVASVTAVSNNASIYSLPRPGINPFSGDFTPADLAGIVRSTGSEDPIVIPTGVGFCMLMTRPALDSIGGFDPSFGRGYGEENDWCMRAIRKGFRHVLAPHAFVYHEGNASMAEAGVIARGETTHTENQRLVVSRYPEYPGLIDEFVEQPELRVMRDRVTAAVLKHLQGRRPTILHWLHADPYGAHAAGTEVTVRGLVEALGKEVVSLVIHPTGTGTLEVSWRANDLVTRRSLNVLGKDFTDDPVVAWERLAGRIIDIEAPDAFHFHDGYRSSISVARAAQQRNVPTVVTLHDFNAVCPRNHLLDAWGAYCGIPSSPAICDVCVSDEGISIDAWRALSAEVLLNADVVTASDPSVPGLLARGLPALQDRQVTIIPLAPDISEPNLVRRRSVRRRVLIPGRVEVNHKGAIVLEELIGRLLAYDIEVHSLGSDDLKARPGFVVHGTYRRSELTEKLAQIDPDVAIIPSMVPETFSFTLSELWAAGIPVIARDVGALGRRIRAFGGGFLVPTGDAGAFADAAIEILGNLMDRADGGRDPHDRRSAGEFTDPYAEFRRIYRRLLPVSG